MLAFQIWAPKGWIGLIIGADMGYAGWNVVNVSFPEGYAISSWAKFLSVAGLSVDELGILIDGTIVVDQSESVACKNPFQYLEIGLQTAMHHRKAGGLLWMIGLDALVAAQRAALFRARLCRLLGAKTAIFPADYMGQQPAHTVEELADYIYQLRNQIAHGDRIRAEYLEKNRFRFDSALVQHVAFAERSFQIVLCEAALFMLCAALRKVITGGHLPLLTDQKRWKKWLDTPA